MTKTEKIRSLLALMTAGILSGCANLPPLIQDHNGNYGLFMPTGNELMAAMTYHQDAKFTIPGGKTCILEHNTINGHVRFLYQNDRYNQMHGWRDMHYISSRMLPDGQVMGLFQGTVNGSQGTQEMVIFHSNSISFVPLGVGGVSYMPVHMTENHVVFRQVNAADPLLRVFSVPQQQLSMPIPQSVVLEREVQIRQRKAMQVEQQEKGREQRAAEQKALREQEVNTNRHSFRPSVQARTPLVPRQPMTVQSHARMVVQAISIQGGTVPVQSDVPVGHQDVMPQAVNLQ